MVLRLSKGPPFFSDGSGRTSEHAPKSSIHMALIAEPCVERDSSIWLNGLA
jgi:hypothetical protein